MKKQDFTIYCDYCMTKDRTPATISMEKDCTFRYLKNNKKIYSVSLDKKQYWCKSCYDKYD